MVNIALVYTGGETSWAMPSGLLYLAAWIKREIPSCSIRIVDANWEEPWKVLLAGKYDLIGLTAMTAQYETVSRLAKLLKAAGRGPIILGGVHVSTAGPDDRSEFDIKITGEGEEQFVDIIRGNKLPFARKPLSLINYPDLDFDLLNSNYWKPRPVRVWHDTVIEATMITSRGCPFKCRFCSTTQFWKVYRTHEPAWVIRQIQSLAEHGVTHLQIFDDLFGCNKNRVKEIATLFRKEGLHKVIKATSCQSRANIIDDEMCDLLKSMNCKIISFGFESGSDRVVKYLKVTGASIAQNKAAIQCVSRNKIRCVGSMIFGSPTESFTEMMASVKFIIWGTLHGLYDMWIFVASPYPMTEFWIEAEKRGIAKEAEKNWDILKLRTKKAGNALLIDIPQWQFRIAWYLAQLALLPFKFLKAIRLLKSTTKLWTT